MGFYVRGRVVVLLSYIRKEAGGGRLAMFYNCDLRAETNSRVFYCVWTRVLTAYLFTITLLLANHSRFRMLTSHNGRAPLITEPKLQPN